MVLVHKMDPITKPAQLTSGLLNSLVLRYLTESRFIHAEFNFGIESGINKRHIDGMLIPPNALVTIVQKGLQYIELEANLKSSDENVDYDFTFLQPLDLITKDVNELQRIIKEKNENLHKDIREAKAAPNKDKKKLKIGENIIANHEGSSKGKSDQAEVCGGPEPADISPSPLFGDSEILSSEVNILEGHLSKVFCCSWSPIGPLLASGSRDSTARIWTIPPGPFGSSSLLPQVQVLEHFKGRPITDNMDVLTLDWNGEGTLLATGSLDGKTRIWSKEGELQCTLAKHKAAILSLKWSKSNFLLSGSADKTAIVWDTRTWDCKQQFKFHSDSVLHVDWSDDTYFATCSGDKMIYVFKIGEARPIKVFAGHEDEVNVVKWNPSGSLLATCSDDKTTKIWSLDQGKCILDFRKHSKEIYDVAWSHTGLCTNYPFQPIILASASVDSTINLWDVDRGTLFQCLKGHREAVHSVAFNPNGPFLASGSKDQCVHIWSLNEGKIIRKFNGGGTVFNVCWNKEGDKLAACFSDSRVCVMDFRI